MISVHQKRFLFVVLLIVLLLTANVAVACPTCKEGLAQGPNAAALVRGYFWSIVFMMSMPFVILLGLGTYFYWEIRKARAAAATAAAPVVSLVSGAPSQP